MEKKNFDNLKETINKIRLDWDEKEDKRIKKELRKGGLMDYKV